jgi:hypothetical protein
LRTEVKQLIEKTKVMDGLQFGKYEGDDYVVVDSYDTIELMNKLLNESGIEHDGAENEIGEHGYQEDYYYCHDCFQFIYVAPQYNGQPNKFVTIGHDCPDYLCLECAKNNRKSEYVQHHINNYNSALMQNGIVTEEELTNMGFSKYGQFSAGMVYGMSDSPQDVYNRLATDWDDVLFMIEDYNPFDTHYSVWVRKAN